MLPTTPAFAQPSRYADTPLRRAITAATRIPEPEAVAALLPWARLPAELTAHVQQLATRLTETLRARASSAGRAGVVQNLLQEYALSSHEGIALMCLAEALLRIPDAATRDALIRDKIAQGHWAAHLGKSASLFVNAATWGLLITGKLASTHSEDGLSAALARLIHAGGEPLIRKGVDMAMRMMGEQFVTGETIEQALDHGSAMQAQGFSYSYDMLGEAALTQRDAERYLQAYHDAIHAIGKASAGAGIFDGPGISIKLSALHPRYSRANYGRVMAELYPDLLRLCALAKRYDIGLNIDAEESDRLELSLDLLERLCLEPQLQGWNGLGFVIQAYQKRCPYVVDYVIDLARRSSRRLMIRLVKGAYWDSEIKRAQIDGLADYPVYTRKPHTDASYLACARKLLAAPDAVFPQFATHNAHTLAAIYVLADPSRYTPQQYEFQCLHGMGEPLYEQVVGLPDEGALGRRCRIYAPVGTHETLLAYLVRRLLENGANTSFVNRVADHALTTADLVRDPVELIDGWAAAEAGPGQPHPAIPLPSDLYGQARRSAQGFDLASESGLLELSSQLDLLSKQAHRAGPMLAVDAPHDAPHRADTTAIRNPADVNDIVGDASDSSTADVDLAIDLAQAASASWAAVRADDRASTLERAADAMQADLPAWINLLIREAGKTAANAIAETREAVDFLRYYAAQARQIAGSDATQARPLGPLVCISPWNFPLAIFIGQVSAGLAAGNVVLAKPAEQTPLIAARAVQMLWDAGIPRAALQLLPGPGDIIGARLVADHRIRGVLFTGSTEVARLLQAALVGRVDDHGRAIPLIAETGGQNAMLVDSSALPEQVVNDVIASAYDSAGQRCSALRVLCVQEEIADKLTDMLLGAMAELQIGNPARLATDVGPLIDAHAKGLVEQHIDAMRQRGHRVHQLAASSAEPQPPGHFLLPTLIEIKHIDELEREVFGPVLHLVRYRRDELDTLLAHINATGYALTLGLHTRIDETIARVQQTAHAGNLYVNRNMVGAVVGVQPFGGEGLSGTGPKAGGPLYLHRLMGQRSDEVLHQTIKALRSVAPTSSGSTAAQASLGAASALQTFIDWADTAAPQLKTACMQLAAAMPEQRSVDLLGPTGERNVYTLVPRSRVLCLADDDNDRLLQLAAILATDGHALWPDTATALRARLPAQIQARITLTGDWAHPSSGFDAVLLHGSTDALTQVQQTLAQRAGPVISVERLAPGDATLPLERLLVERVRSINTAAAGGNASLMTIA